MAGAAVALSAPAFAFSPVPPKITATQVTFPVPGGTANTFTLRLWSHGTVEGTASGTSGMLKVPVPVTSDCAFQADVSVLPAGGGPPFFYSGSRATVPGCGPPSTIAGHIFLCSTTGSPTTTEVTGGTLTSTGPQNLPSQANPLTDTTVTSGTYTMAATSPATYVFVPCGSPAIIAASGTDATESVVVPSGGHGVGSFYVVLAAPTGSLGGGSGPGSGLGNGGGPATNPGGPGTPTVISASKPSATNTNSSALAFTGLDTGPLLLSGLLLLLLGAGATGLSRARRRQT
jgi:hypothetical protein